MRLDTLDRFLAGLAILMSAAALLIAYLFRYDGYYSAFGRLGASIAMVFGVWVVSAVVAGLIWAGGNLMKFPVPVKEAFFTLACGGCAVSILGALRIIW